MRLVLVVLLSACAIQNPPAEGTTVAVGNDSAKITVSPTGIADFVKRGDYKSWTADAAVREQTQNSPHGKVRVFFNNTLVAAVRANQEALPVGSMAVKELYESDGTTLDGFAAMIKGEPGASWVWWEAFEPTVSEAHRFGVDHTSCKGCHSSGKDSLRSQLP